MVQYIKIDGEWVAISARYMKVNGEWVVVPESGFPESEIYEYAGHVGFELSIVGAETVSGISSNYCVLRDGIEDVQSHGRLCLARSMQQ